MSGAVVIIQANNPKTTHKLLHTGVEDKRKNEALPPQKMDETGLVATTDRASSIREKASY